MSARRRVVITGIGSVSAAGCGGSALMADVLARRAQTIAPVKAFALDGCGSRLAAEVDDARLMTLLDPDAVHRFLDRMIQNHGQGHSPHRL